MSPTTKLAMTVLLIAAACGADTAAPPTDAAAPPTYTELFDRYFAPGTPGHCANDGCHNGANYNIWLCGHTKDSCYQGMAGPNAGLINTANPAASLIADPKNSPLRWINPNGPMPFDTPGSFPEGRNAIVAWVAAGARND